ncbi:MAG: hypothetical protein HFJ79_02955 [Clostridiales bacterium]|nr:hypothetical protein [Clostridiales bacterium]
MANNDEKVSKFVDAITEYAEEQSRKIHQEVEDYKAERLHQAEQQVLQDAYLLIQKESAEMRSDRSRDVSRRELEARSHLLEKRRDGMESVFAEAADRLRAYTKTPAYAEGLKQSMAAITEKLPEGERIYYLSRGDEALLEGLKALCPADGRLELTDDIRLGGIRGENRRAGVIADDTLDQKLEKEREWFTAYSGLTLE